MLASGFDIKKLKQEITVSSLSITIILLLIFGLNKITGYNGFTFIPGLRMARESLFNNTAFLAHSTPESNLGLLAIELIIGSIFFLLIREYLRVTYLKKKAHPAFKIRQLLISLPLLFGLNLLLSQAN